MHHALHLVVFQHHLPAFDVHLQRCFMQWTCSIHMMTWFVAHLDPEIAKCWKKEEMFWTFSALNVCLKQIEGWNETYAEQFPMDFVDGKTRKTHIVAASISDKQEEDELLRLGNPLSCHVHTLHMITYITSSITLIALT
jgi:hypothetical protein